jgi:hypothetical protein
MADALPKYEDECFFIAPIGTDGSDIRKRSDGVRDFIVQPAVAAFGLATLRADDLAKPGQITLQVIEHVLRAKGVVADLTGSNPNVFYELAIRHTAKLPVVLIAEEGEVDRLPFDIAQMRVISFDHRDLASAARAQTQITQHLREALDGAVDSPIATALTLEALNQGDTVERALGELLSLMNDLSWSNRSVADEVRYLRLASIDEPLEPQPATQSREFTARVTPFLLEEGSGMMTTHDKKLGVWHVTLSRGNGQSVSWTFSRQPGGEEADVVIRELGIKDLPAG